MSELIESLLRLSTVKGRSFTVAERAEAAIAMSEAAASLEAAQEGACIKLLTDIRWACGDEGKRMQPELVEFIRALREDAERWQFVRGQSPATIRVDGNMRGSGLPDGLAPGYYRANTAEELDATIDQARGKGVADEA